MPEQNNEVIFVINVPPQRCPCCGTVFTWDRLSRYDFFAHAAQTCNNCGAKFQCANGTAIEKTAREAGGDL